MNLYGLSAPSPGATAADRRKFLDQLEKLRRSPGSQAGLRSRRGAGRDLVTGKRLSGCRVSASEQEQLRRDRGSRKSQRRKDRKAGIRC